MDSREEINLTGAADAGEGFGARLREVALPGAIAVFACLVALTFLGSAFDPFEYVKTAIIRVACLAGLFYWVGEAVVSRRFAWRGTRADGAILLYMLWCSLSFFYTSHPFMTFNEFLKIGCGFAIYLFAAQRVRNGRGAELILLGVAGAAAGVAALGLLELLHRDVFPWDYLLANRFYSVFSSFDNLGRMAVSWSNDFDGRVSSSIGNPVYLAGYVVLTLPVCAGLCVVSRGRLKTAVAYAGTLGLIFLLFASFTRSAWAAAAAGLALFFFLARRYAPDIEMKRWLRRTLPLCVFAVVMLGVFSFRNPINTSRFSVVKRVSEFSVSKDDSSRQRMMLWRTTWEMVKGHPLRGVGVGQFPAAYPFYQARLFGEERWRKLTSFPTRAHNDLLEALAETGAVGLALFLWVLWGALRGGFISKEKVSRAGDGRAGVLAAGLTAGLAGLVLYSNFQFPLHVEATAAHFWLFAGLLAALDWRVFSGVEERVVFDYSRNAGGRRGFAEFPAHVVFAGALALCFLSLASVALRPLEGSLLFERGLRVDNGGKNPNGALDLLEAGIDAYPKDPEMCGMMASTLFRRSREAGIRGLRDFYYEQGIKAAGRCLSMRPLDCRIWSMLGRAYIEAGEADKAIKALRKAVDINPVSYEPFYNLGIAYSLAGRYNESVEALRRCVRLSPGFVPAYLNLGNAYKMLGRRGEALAVYMRALELDGKSPLTNTTVGAILGEMGRDAEAESYLRRGLKLGPDLPDVRGNLGVLLLKRGRYAEAEALLLDVARMTEGKNSASEPVALYQLGELYEKTGRRDEAVSAWRRALSVAPGAQAIKKRLSEVGR